MNMFTTLLNSIPKNRSDYVDDLDIPDITLSPYVCPDPYDSLSPRSDSLLTDSIRAFDRRTLSTASSIPLSRAMTDSDIDYGFYKRYRDYHYADTWEHLRRAIDAFPPYYLSSLNRYGIIEANQRHVLPWLTAASRRLYNEKWWRRMKAQFDDCYPFAPDDPALYELQAAVRRLDKKVLDLKALEADLDRIKRRP
uniref:SFRICE_019870 n=1 Tax=Spodoptera frugiperda TaxID=7108 RepID=A0A2H1VJZ4_SPOFR